MRKLDSVPGSGGFYEDLGFQRDFESFRFTREGATFSTPTQPIRATDLEDVLSFDKATTGLDRGRVLMEIYNERPGWRFLLRESGEIHGLVLARSGEETIQIGPCVSAPENARCAADLLRRVLSVASAGKFRMCVPGISPKALALARGLGFEATPSTTRMHLGIGLEESEAAFAMISPEKG